MIYLDNNATSPLDPRVLERMLPWLRDGYGNPSSVHAAGQRARAAIDDAREILAAGLGCAPKELVFTCGGTEADNLALRGLFTARKATHRRVVISAVEHPAVLDTARSLAADGAEVVVIAVDGEGRLDEKAFAAALTPDTALASVMWANNETGVLFPVERLGAVCRERGVPFHVDAVQAFGKVPIDLATQPIDLLSVSAHKIHGPKGVGALFVRRGLGLAGVQTGGHQERGRRSGTENVAGIVGFGEAVRLAAASIDENRRLAGLRDRLEAGLLRTIRDARVAGAGAPRLPTTSNVCFRGVEGEALLTALDLAGICASSGSACTSGSLEPSHVLVAMGVHDEFLAGAVRFSLGRQNTEAEVERVLEVMPGMVGALRSTGSRFAIR